MIENLVTKVGVSGEKKLKPAVNVILTIMNKGPLLFDTTVALWETEKTF